MTVPESGEADEVARIRARYYTLAEDELPVPESHPPALRPLTARQARQELIASALMTGDCRRTRLALERWNAEVATLEPSS